MNDEVRAGAVAGCFVVLGAASAFVASIALALAGAWQLGLMLQLLVMAAVYLYEDRGGDD